MKPNCPKHGTIPQKGNTKPRTLCPHPDCKREVWRQRHRAKVKSWEALGWKRVAHGWVKDGQTSKKDEK